MIKQATEIECLLPVVAPMQWLQVNGFVFVCILGGN